jgi:hypothetical protein
MLCGKQLPRPLARDVVKKLEEPICEECYDRVEAEETAEDLEELKEI